MNDVPALEFTRQHAQPIPAERREELLATPGFGDVFSDHMVTVRWHAELGWHDARVGPLAAFSLHPATMALHYGQTVFEGLKAFWRPNGQRALFRPADHARRFNSSARRMALPRCRRRTSSRRWRLWCGSMAPGCHAPAGTACICGRS
jgi:Branched-chain amino acid aminotransferase/4-amino-4-deoxychorismate lyase